MQNSMTTKRVRLRPVGVQDYSFLYQTATDPEGSHLWRYRGATPSPEAFTRDLWDAVLAQFLVERPTGEPLGLVVAYNPSLTNGTCYLGAVAAAPATASGLVVEAAALLVSHVFRNFPMRRIHLEVPGYGLGQFANGIERYAEQEGQLRESVFYDGRYWDLHIFTISRDDWVLKHEPRLAVLTGADGR